jgi:predicted transcriptional regulator
MPTMEEQVLRATKEIVVKFIETGRISPTSFPEAFKNIHQTVKSAVTEQTAAETEPGESPPGQDQA